MVILLHIPKPLEKMEQSFIILLHFEWKESSTTNTTKEWIYAFYEYYMEGEHRFL